MRRVGGLGMTLLAIGGSVVGGLTLWAGSGAAPVIVHQARQVSVASARASSRTASWASSNWSGYAETGTFSTITGNWTVPAVTAGAAGASGGRFGRNPGTTSWYSATWLGIDGYNNSDLIQTGTEQDYYSGSAHYTAWWEILPASETVISEPVAAGDQMTATITKTSATVSVRVGRRGQTTESLWQVTVGDTTQGWTFTTTQAYTGPGTSAEWIVEAPSVNGRTAALADYAFPAAAAGAGDFHGAGVATGIGQPMVPAALSYANDAGVMVQNNAQVSTPGQPDGPQTAFNSLYGPTAPGPPTT